MSATVDTPFVGQATRTAVTEGHVTVTANDTEANIRKAAEFPLADAPSEPSKDTTASDSPADEANQRASEPAEDRNPDGTFKAKPKDDKGGDPRKSVQAKINEERRLRGDAERKAAEIEARLAAAEAKLAAGSTPKPVSVAGSADPTSAQPKPPTYLDLVKRYQGESDWPTLQQAIDAGFEDPYQAATTAQAAYIQTKQFAERDAATAAQQAEAQAADVLGTVTQTASERYPDFAELLKTPTAEVELSAAVNNELYLYLDPSLSADIAHYLLTHPDEMDALGAVPDDPIAAARAIGALKTTVSLGLSAAHSGPATAPRQTKAKPLIKPVGASPAAPEASPPDALPFGKRYIDAMNEQERKERGRATGA